MASASFFLVFAALACALIAVHGFPRDGALVSATDLVNDARSTDAPAGAVPARPAPESKLRDDGTKGIPASAAPTSASPERRDGRSKGTLVIVIDDVGYNMKQLEPFLAFPGALTMAVLPNVPYSKKAAERIHAAGKELILHQPMEAIGNLDEGGGALRSGMSAAEMVRTIERNVMQLPGAVGMNNHMGSAATRDPVIVETVLDTTRRLGLYFLDSMTIGDSLVGPIAARKRVRTWERDVFLDNKPDRESMEKVIAEGKRIASRYGRAVLIGHVWSAELAQTLMDLYPALVEEGFTLSTISRIMQEEAHENSGD